MLGKNLEKFNNVNSDMEFGYTRNSDKMKRIEVIWILVITAIIAIFTVLCLLNDNVSAKTITVNDDGGADYEKIQDAIDNQ